MKIRMLWVLVLIPNIVSATIRYPWPIATGVEVTLTGPNSADYKVTMGTVEIVDHRYAPDVTTKTVLCDNMVFCTTPTYGGYHRHNQTYVPRATFIEWYRINGDWPWADTAAKIANDYGNRVVTLWHEGSANGNECVGATVTDWDNYTDPFSTWIARTWNGGAGTTGDCLGTPPANEWCSLTTPQLLINYNTLTLQNAPGTKKSSTVEVECTTGMKYTLRLRGQESIKLSNGMEAQLTANKASLGSSLTGSQGKNPVTIESTLTGTPNKAGTFEGNGVLFVSYP